MKKLAYLIIIISLPVLVFFQYRSYTRYNPATDFGFTPSDSIDVNYYDPSLLQDYYRLVFEIPAFARGQWSNAGIDVKYPEQDTEALKAAAHFNQMLATVNLIEEKLIQSFLLKKQGFSNSDISKIESEGISVQQYQLNKYEELIGIAKGDVSSAVWELQKHLLQLGYELPKDGIFDIKTETALKDLQSKHDFFPSGIVEKNILPFLIKD